MKDPQILELVTARTAAARKADCWEWTGYRNPQGYGQLTFKHKTYMAHRLAFEAACGDIPPGMTVDHICFNRSCVNPVHLRLLTHAENASRQRTARPERCVNGHALDEENTYLAVRRVRRTRQCRICNRDAARRYRLRRKRVTLERSAS